MIATTMNNSFDTARSVMEDLDSGNLDMSAAKSGAQSIRTLLEQRGTCIDFKVVICRTLLINCSKCIVLSSPKE